MAESWDDIADGEWVRLDWAAEDATLALAAALKAAGGPEPSRLILRTASLALCPRLVTGWLTGAERAAWLRAVGVEADPARDHHDSPGRIDEYSNQLTAHLVGAAVAPLRGRGHLVERGPVADPTWEPGPGLEGYYTEGWPDGRTRFVLAVLRRRGEP